MKTPSRRTAFRVTMVVLATVAAYLLGAWQRQMQINAPPAGNGQVAKNQAAKNAAVSRNGMPPDYPVEMMQVDNLSALTEKNPKEGMAELLKLPPGKDTQMLYSRLFGDLAGDPEFAATAAALALDLPPGPNRDIALQSLIRIWGQTGPKDLLDWASKLPSEDSNLFKDAMMAVISTQESPALASQFLGAMTDPSARSQVITAMTLATAKDDPAGTLDWLNQVATRETYQDNVKRVFGNLYQRDPAQAAALLGKVTDPIVHNLVMTTLATNWGQSDPQSALAWAQTLPDDQRAAFVQSLTKAQAASK